MASKQNSPTGPSAAKQENSSPANAQAADHPRNTYLGDDVPGLVPASRLNQGDTGAASDKPEAGGELDFDDGDMWDRGNTARTGGTWAAEGADSAPLGAPAEIFSDSNQPSDQQDRPEGPSSDGDTA